ncbi:FecCD family ABC transporter permease [Jatrophihabitans sp. DSM 45814]
MSTLAARAEPKRTVVLLTALSATLVVVSVLSAGMGAFAIPPAQILGSLLERLHIPFATHPDQLSERVLWGVRFPRVLLALLVGASLGCAGALMQGVFGNPLAEPGIVGISSGAAVGAIVSIIAGLSFASWSVSGPAFVAGLFTVLLVYGVSRSNGRTEVVTLILAGIAINTITGAGIGLLTYFSTDSQLRSITFWSLGSVSGATWPAVAAVAPCALVGLLLAPRFARALDLLSLGEQPARHLGVNVERVRVAVIVVVAILTAAAVSVAGAISFVGLVVPHLVRMVSGPGHRILIPASALGGAIVLTLADLLCRTVAAPAEIPLGSVTALVGGPFFFWLLLRTRTKQGGWA